MFWYTETTASSEPNHPLLQEIHMRARREDSPGGFLRKMLCLWRGQHCHCSLFHLLFQRLFSISPKVVRRMLESQCCLQKRFLLHCQASSPSQHLHTQMQIHLTIYTAYTFCEKWFLPMMWTVRGSTEMKCHWDIAWRCDILAPKITQRQLRAIWPPGWVAMSSLNVRPLLPTGPPFGSLDFWDPRKREFCYMKSMNMWAAAPEMCSEVHLINLVINKHCIEVELRGQEEAQLCFCCKKEKIHN